MGQQKTDYREILETRGLKDETAPLFDALIGIASAADRCPSPQTGKKREEAVRPAVVKPAESSGKMRIRPYVGLQYSQERRAKVLRELQANPGGCSLAQLTRVTGIPKNSLKDLLSLLGFRGMVVKVAAGKRAIFRLAPAFDAEAYFRVNPDVAEKKVVEAFAAWNKADKKRGVPPSRELLEGIRRLIEQESQGKVAKKLGILAQTLNQIMNATVGEPSPGDADGDIFFPTESGESKPQGELENLHRSLEDWRKCRKDIYERIPCFFNRDILEAVRKYGRTRVSKKLGLNFKTLERLERRHSQNATTILQALREFEDCVPGLAGVPDSGPYKKPEIGSSEFPRGFDPGGARQQSNRSWL